MTEQINITGYNNYLNGNNISNQQCPNIQQLTSESNISENGSSAQNETPKDVKSFKTQIIEIKNATTKRGKKNGTNIVNSFLAEKDTRYQTKETTTLLGNKRPQPDTPDYESIIKEVREQALIDIVQYLNDLSLFIYGYNSDFKIDQNLLKQENFFETNLDENIKKLLLMMEEDSEKERINKQMKDILELELEQKYNNLLICKEILKMKLKDLLLVYINDLYIRFNHLRYKTLKDNPNYTNEEKMEIRNHMLNYLETHKEQIHSINYNEEMLIQPILDLNLLSNGGNNEEQLSLENENMNIQNNQEENHNNLIEENQELNESEDMNIQNNQEENVNNIFIEEEESNENGHMNNENNQTENHNNLIEENQEPIENGHMNNETNQTGTHNNLIEENQRGTRNDNLVRITIKFCLIFLCQMIENIVHMGLDTKKLHSYDYINGNSSEKFKKFFDRKVGDILKEFYQNNIESILNSNCTSEEIEFFQRLLTTQLFHIIEKYINNIPYSFINSKGDKVELKTFKDVEDQRIRDKSSKIRNKINKILKADGRLRRPKTNKNKK